MTVSLDNQSVMLFISIARCVDCLQNKSIGMRCLRYFFEISCFFKKVVGMKKT